MARKTILGMPVAEYERLATQDCTRCGSAGKNHPQRDKTVLCHDCITAINAEINAQRAAANAAAPRCEGCATKRGTRYLLCTDRRVLVCGTCRTKVNRAIRQVALFGAPQATSAQVFEVLGRR